MKNQIIEIIKVVVGILLGTVILMYAIWYMTNVVLHPYMIIFVLFVLFVLSIIIAGITMGYKLIIVVIGSFIFGLLGFSIYYKHTCDPNEEDIKVMKPMAKKISEYIVKNGIPKSLKDISDLPYALEKCRKEITYADKYDVPRKYITEGAKWEETQEICHYKNIIINLGFAKDIKRKDAKWNGHLEMDSIRGTGLFMYIDEQENNQFYHGEMSLNGKHSGICKSWRQ